MPDKFSAIVYTAVTTLLLTIVAGGLFALYLYKSGLENGRESRTKSWVKIGKDGVMRDVIHKLKYRVGTSTEDPNTLHPIEGLSSLYQVYEIHGVRTIVMVCENCEPNYPKDKVNPLPGQKVK